MNGEEEERTTPVTAASEARSGMGARMTAVGMPAEKSRDLKGSTRRLIGRLLPERLAAVAVLVLSVGSVALTVSGPKILGRATNVIVAGLFGPSGIDFGELHRILLTVAAIYAGAALLAAVQGRLLAGVVQRSMFHLRSDVEDKLHRLPLGYIDGQPRGDLLSRVTNDIDNVSQSLQQTLSQMLTSLLTLVGVVIMMFTISPLLALITLITVPVSIGTMQGIAKHSKKRFVAQWAHTGTLNAQVEETFTGHTLVKVFGHQRETEERFAETNQELYTSGFFAQFLVGIIQPAMMFFGNLNFVAIAVIGGVQVTNGAMTIGSIQAFIQYSRLFTQPLTQVASMFNVLQSGIASAERVFALLDAPEESPDPVESDAATDGTSATPATNGVRGEVAFEDIAFSYRDDQPLIEDLSLIAEPGHTVAIVGPTGAGKTTLVNLLMRFYDLDEGRITLDGRDITTMSRRALRANTGMVLQDTWMFSGTIRENIAYGNLEADEAAILAAAKATYVDRFVHALPEGYDTVVDDEGGSLSAGQKQLLTIARAFLADPTILILDEATSSVDTRTEVLIQEAMAALRSNRTSFVIAHRLSTIRDADTILVMENGRIVEQGGHDELLGRDGPYSRLYQAQFSAPAVDLDAP
jgi:ATP-binding cassette subfamily B protein